MLIYYFLVGFIYSNPIVNSFSRPRTNFHFPIRNDDLTESEIDNSIVRQKHNPPPLIISNDLVRVNNNENIQCQLPLHDHIVPITPGLPNSGWAMSPHERCSAGSWCPYACKSGMYSAQWDPQSKCSIGPKCGSKNGGLFCNSKGELVKPFPDRPYCEEGLTGVQISNQLEGSVSICQTVFPGNEVMIIPTVARPKEILNLLTPPSTYWFNTSAHFYVNMPNTDASHCIWGQPDYPVGNWAPFIIGTNEGFQKNSFVSVQVNPLFIESGLIERFKPYTIRFKCRGNCPGYECSVSTLRPKELCIIAVDEHSHLEIIFTNS